MDQKVYDEAIENIALIKQVIEKTKKSFVGFSQIFIYWGLLFIPNSILSLLLILNRDTMMELMENYPALGFLSPTLIFALIAALIYRQIGKRMPLVGLENHLMKIWLLILAMNLIPTRIRVDLGDAAINNVVVHVDQFSTLLFSLGIALLITSMFTGYKQLSYVATAYVLISIAYAYLNPWMIGGTLVQLVYLCALPATFLFTGFYLRTRHVRGD